MSQNVIQSSFSAGELSPNLYAHVDLAKYHTGVALARNFFVDYRGGLSTRAGTRFVGQCYKSGFDVRLIPFQFSTVQTYMLEFGHLYIRVIKDGGYVLETSQSITAITQASPGVVTKVAHGYTTDDWLELTVAGMTELNGRTVGITVLSADTFSMYDIMTGTAIDTSGFGAFTSGDMARIYTITTPYLGPDLFTLKYVQSADVMTITHIDYAPRNLTRTGHAAWTLSTISFGVAQAGPTLLAGVASAAGTTNYAYVVTAVAPNGEEAASNVASVTAAVNIATTVGTITLSWVAAAGAVAYNIYKATPVDAAIPAGVNFGFIASVTGIGYVDGNDVPDFTFTPPLPRNPFTSNNPGTVGYFQQRRVFGGSFTYPETLWMSQPGAFNNFNVTDPSADDNAITATLISNQVNNIKHMVAMPGGLIVLTGGGAWQVSGGGDNAPITPRSITATPQAYNGCSDVPPLVINYDILYNQALGSVVRDLSYSFYTNIYTGADISVLSNHLLLGRSVTGWAYAEDPFKVIWSVTSDGDLLSLTFLKEQEVYGWAHSDTLGFFRSVATIPEGTTTAVYVVVQRLINGRDVRYVERFAERFFPYGVEDAWCSDAGLTNELTYPTGSMFASSSVGPTVLFTCSSPSFSAGDIGKILRAGGGIATITGFTDANNITGTLTQPITEVIPNSFDLLGNPVPIIFTEGNWSLTSQFTTFGGLWHLVGETVQMLGDGNVYDPQEVSATGTVTFEEPVSKAIIGLGYQCQIQTLYLDTGEPTIQAKRKKIAAMTTRVHEARGLKMGATFETLMEYRMGTGDPVELYTGDQRIIMDPLWQTQGQICIQQDYPLPATVLGVIPEIVVGDTNEVFQGGRPRR